MIRISLLLLAFTAFLSCKKCNDDTIGLTGSRWNLFFKNNSTFTFYAEAELNFKTNSSVENYRNFDTLTGNWLLENNTISIAFNNGDQYNGILITSDSISGTLTASGNNGFWYATKN